MWLVDRRIAGEDSISLTMSCRCSVSRATMRHMTSCGPLIASASMTSGTAAMTSAASASRPCVSSSSTNALIG